MNDGTAFLFVMLGLWLMNLHAPEASSWRWLALDLVRAVTGGLGVGALIGTLVGRLVIYLRRKYREALGLDEFLSLGLIGLSHGLALAKRRLPLTWRTRCSALTNNSSASAKWQW